MCSAIRSARSASAAATPRTIVGGAANLRRNMACTMYMSRVSAGASRSCVATSTRITAPIPVRNPTSGGSLIFRFLLKLVRDRRPGVWEARLVRRRGDQPPPADLQTIPPCQAPLSGARRAPTSVVQRRVNEFHQAVLVLVTTDRDGQIVGGAEDAVAERHAPQAVFADLLFSRVAHGAEE